VLYAAEGLGNDEIGPGWTLRGKSYLGGRHDPWT
jgi:hypothetical protein